MKGQWGRWAKRPEAEGTYPKEGMGLDKGGGSRRGQLCDKLRTTLDCHPRRPPKGAAHHSEEALEVGAEGALEAVPGRVRAARKGPVRRLRPP